MITLYPNRYSVFLMQDVVGGIIDEIVYLLRTKTLENSKVYQWDERYNKYQLKLAYLTGGIHRIAKLELLIWINDQLEHRELQIQDDKWRIFKLNDPHPSLIDLRWKSFSYIDYPREKWISQLCKDIPDERLTDEDVLKNPPPLNPYEDEFKGMEDADELIYDKPKPEDDDDIIH